VFSGPLETTNERLCCVRLASGEIVTRRALVVGPRSDMDYDHSSMFGAIGLVDQSVQIVWITGEN